VRDLGVACTTLEDVFLRINDDDMQRLKQIISENNLAAQHTAADDADTAANDAGGEGGGGDGGGGDGGGGEGGGEGGGGEGGSGEGSGGEGGGEGGGGDGGAAVNRGLTPSAGAAAVNGSFPTVVSTVNGLSQSKLLVGANVFRGLVAKRALTARRDLLTTCCSFCCPVWLVLIALLLLGVSTRLADPGGALLLEPDAAFAASIGSRGFVSATGVPMLVPDKDTQPWAALLNADGWAVETGVPECPTGIAAAQNVSAYLGSHPSGTRPAAFATASLHLPSPAVVPLLPAFLRPFARQVLKSGALSEVLFAFFNSTSTHAMPTILTSAYDALLSNTTNGSARLSTSAHALPYSKREEATISSIIAVFASIMILVPFAFVGALFITPLLREREAGSKQMQFVSGVSGPAYWFASWTWDAMLYLGVLLCTLIVFFIADKAVPAAADAFVGTSEAVGATALALSLFGFAAIALASAASFFFTSPSAGDIIIISSISRRRRSSSSSSSSTCSSSSSSTRFILVPVVL